MRRFALALSSSVVALVAVAVPVLAGPPPSSADAPPAVPGELLVGYRDGTTAAERAEARSQASTKLVEQVVAGRSGRQEVELVAFPAGADRDAAIRRLENHPDVTYAEPNWILTTAATSDDPAYTGNKLWGMYGDATSPANQYGSQAGEAWAAGATGSSSVVVGVIDTGVDIGHPDLAANIWTNPGEIGGNGKDDDGNGFVDDVNGWDFHNGDASVYDSGDGDKHGTHVAGTIAGVGGNATGVAGVAWNAKIIPAKFLGPKGGTTSSAVKAVDYLTDLKSRHGLDLVASNNSWGGGSYSSSLYSAIERANTAGILFVAAAGNGGSDGVGDDNDANAYYPSSYENSNVIAVASMTSSGAKSGFSNYGATRVDLGAPGSSIYSTLPGNTYGTYSGTSMAAPHVTGGAVLAAASGVSGDELVKAAILDSTVWTASMDGKTVTDGRLDVSGFVAAVTSAATANPDEYSAAEDTQLVVGAPGVLADDILDPAGTTAVLATQPLDGTVTMALDGSFTYTPAANTNGSDSFTYQAADSQGVLSAPATVTITVAAANDAPVALDDAYTATVGEQLTVAAPGVLANDSDLEGSSLSATVVSGPSHGTLALSPDGSFTFTTDTAEVTSFTYEISDGVTTSAPATVSIAVGTAVVETATSSADIRYVPFGGKTNNNHLDIQVVMTTGENLTPVAGAVVTATVNGVTKTATTDSNGVAMVATYRNVRKGTTFTTTVTGVVATPTWDAVSVTESFTVQ